MIVLKTRDVEALTAEEKLLLIEQIKICNGLLMPGGLKSYSFDYFVDDYTKEIRIPVLGECLGMQIMARNHNGAKILKCDTQINHYDKENLYAHKINFVDDTKLAKKMN